MTFLKHRLKSFFWRSYLSVYTQPVHIADVIVYELVFCPMWTVLLREADSSLPHCLSACLFMTVLLLSAVSVLWQHHRLWLYIACHVKWYLPLILLLMLWETERRLCSLIIFGDFIWGDLYIFFFLKTNPLEWVCSSNIKCVVIDCFSGNQLSSTTAGAKMYYFTKSHKKIQMQMLLLVFLTAYWVKTMSATTRTA